MAEEWFGTFEGAGLDGIIAKPVDGTYEPGKRSLVKVKHQRTALCAVPGYRVHKDGNGVGSLLLGLYDGDGEMHSVGVAAAFSVARRAELLVELEPRTHDALVDHPWRGWAEWQDERAESGTVSTQGGSRWNAGKDLSFVPLAMGLVAEVTFGQLEGGRFRHGVSFVRWRPDVEPGSVSLRPARRGCPRRLPRLHRVGELSGAVDASSPIEPNPIELARFAPASARQCRRRLDRERESVPER